MTSQVENWQMIMYLDLETQTDNLSRKLNKFKSEWIPSRHNKLHETINYAWSVIIRAEFQSQNQHEKVRFLDVYDELKSLHNTKHGD